jgi:hypothetical protein
MTNRQTVSLPRALAGVLALACVWTLPVARAQDTTQAGHHPAASDRASISSTFINTVREATARFRDPAQAEREGYNLLFGCVSGPDWGAMGLHYVNLALVGDGVLDPAKPEIVIYEPLPNGRLRLTGADFLVFTSSWHATNEAPPELGGQLLHLFESPNRFGLPDFYTLHVWAWKDNPAGTFSNWHSRVSCDAYSGERP